MRSRIHDARSVIGFLLILGVFCALSSYSRAADRTNVPLRNWSGFAIHWNWTYDAIKKLVLAGLTDRAVLNTKPMTRLEVARIVAQAIAQITGDEGGQYADRQDLEDILYRLLDEFQPELAELGVEAALQQGQPPGFFQIKPLDKLQVRTAYSKESYDLENNQGDSFEAGFKGRLATFSRGQIGDFFSATLSPELRINEKGSVNARVLEGFAKFTQYNVEAGGGRESLWWGPGFNRSMLLSTNGRPFDLIKVGAAEQFTLPWIFEYLGPTKLTYFLGQLGSEGQFPHTKLTGLRLNFTPASFLEDFYVRIGRWFGPDVLVGLEFDRSKIGLVTAGGTNLPRDKRYVAGLDVSYRFSKWLTLFEGYRFTRSDNQGSVPDLDIDNHLLRVEATFSF